MTKPFDLDDVRTLEEDEDASPLANALALQRAINSGMWKLQGSYGRAMMAAIEAGEAALGPNPAYDFYGNRIPSRTEIEPGTKGSLEFVEAEMGPDWRKAIEAA